jgi:hypothetical protein
MGAAEEKEAKAMVAKREIVAKEGIVVKIVGGSVRRPRGV